MSIKQTIAKLLSRKAPAPVCADGYGDVISQPVDLAELGYVCQQGVTILKANNADYQAIAAVVPERMGLVVQRIIEGGSSAGTNWCRETYAAGFVYLGLTRLVRAPSVKLLAEACDAVIDAGLGDDDAVNAELDAMEAAWREQLRKGES